jgi:hypothetical protein
LVTWRSPRHSTGDSWYFVDEVDCVLRIVHSVGFLVWVSPDEITIAAAVSSVGGERQITDDLTIPRSSIISWKLLKAAP